MFKIRSFKIAILFCVVFIYQFTLFVNLIFQPIKYNFYDFIIKDFGYLSLFYTISLLYLIMIYNICQKTSFHKYLFLRFKNRKQIYNANVLATLIIAIAIVLFINLLTIIQCFAKVSFKNLWSPYFFHTMTGKVNLFYTDEAIKIITNKLSPLSYVVYSDIFVILYLFFLGLLFLVTNIFFKKRSLSLILILAINYISMSFDSGKGIISKLSFTNNIYFITANVSELQNNFFIIFRLCYWLILIFIMFLIGKLFTAKSDYYFGE